MLVAENITKIFPGVKALDDVCMELHPGKVNAIIGENGAGKSTLMKILSGVYSDFEGTIHFNGKPVKFADPKQAQDNGITIIHQELNLIPYLSITENIFLGRELTTAWGILDKKGMASKTKSLLERLRLNVDPGTLVCQLKVGQQQVVEIAKALLVDAEVIIMDEPTSAISESEVEVLFGIIASLKNEGKVIVYISHKLDELFRIADRFIVLRDGRSIEAGDMKGMTHDAIINKMVGRDISVMNNKDIPARGDSVLSVENISLKHPLQVQEVVKNISFTVSRGEIVGIFGLMGAGRTELLETIFGIHAKLSTGKIRVNGRQVHCSSPSAAINAGIALVPEDRKKDGLVLGLSARENISLTTLEEMEIFGVLNNNSETKLAEKYISQLQIKTPSDKQIVKNLSGGNQQKIVLAKWLATKPIVLMLDEPTRGIDINAKIKLTIVFMT